MNRKVVSDLQQSFIKNSDFPICFIGNLLKTKRLKNYTNKISLIKTQFISETE